jgi:hypothetical protein
MFLLIGAYRPVQTKISYFLRFWSVTRHSRASLNGGLPRRSTVTVPLPTLYDRHTEQTETNMDAHIRIVNRVHSARAVEDVGT